MKAKLRTIIVACLLLACTGCLPEGDVRVRPLPAPAPEQPIANLPTQLHQRNWTGRLNQGSCVHASLVNHLRWLNEFELGERWRATYSDGEWDWRLRSWLDAADIGLDPSKVNLAQWNLDDTGCFVREQRTERADGERFQGVVSLLATLNGGLQPRES